MVGETLSKAVSTPPTFPHLYCHKEREGRKRDRGGWGKRERGEEEGGGGRGGEREMGKKKGGRRERERERGRKQTNPKQQQTVTTSTTTKIRGDEKRYVPNWASRLIGVQAADSSNPTINFHLRLPSVSGLESSQSLHRITSQSPANNTSLQLVFSQ